MRFLRTAFAILSASLAAVLQTWAASFPRSIVPVAGATAAQGVGGEKTYGRVVRTALTADEMTAGIDFDVALKLTNRADLEARINRGEILSRAALEAYLPTAADYAKVRAWLVAQGFRITLDADSRHAIFARGSNARIAAALGVKLARVATADGEFTSAVTEPSLPDEIAGLVAGVRGLQPHLIRHPRSPRGQQLEANSYYAITPAAVAAVYQAPTTLTGAGQTIAVIGDSIPSTSDLSEFRAECGLSQTMINISVANVQGGPGTDTTDQFEMSMDVEWTSGLAPAAQVRVYAVPYPLNPNSEEAAYTQILNDLPTIPTIHQMTESYGGIEPSSSQDGDSSLVLLIAQGVTCFAASADGGSNPDPTTGAYNARAPLSVSYPASDPSMTAVGGTTLIFPRSDNGQYAPPEVAWSLTTNRGMTGATGGGISGVFSRPSWQVATGMPAGNQRCVPDVSAVAFTGSATDDMAPLVYQGGAAYSGSGTSLSSPIWAGLCALINQSLANASMAPVGFLNPKIYAAAGSSCFTDITSGSNGAYSAGAGYDLCTGLGTPLVGNLIMTLNGAPVLTAQPVSQTVPLGSTASFTAAALGMPAPTYQWQVSTNGGSSWTNLTNTAPYSGTATGTLTIAEVTVAMDGYQYHCLASNSVQGNVTSSAATLRITTPGSLWAMGDNTYGQLGDGTTMQQLVPELILPGGVRAVAAGGSFSLILKTDGSLLAMGDNRYGQLGDRTTMQQLAPELILPGGVQAVAAGGSFSLILKTDGSLWAMGDNTYGQLGDGTMVQQLAPELILPDGVQAVAAGGGFSLILKTDGSLWATGDNEYGQLGDGTTMQQLAPELILPGGVKAIAAGDYHSLILKTDGSLWAMGDNEYGQLGDGTLIRHRNTPVQILSGGVQAVAAGDGFSLFVKTDGGGWAMGTNTAGQLGDGTTTQRNAPVPIQSSSVQAVAAGYSHSLILKTNGSLWVTGYNSSGQLGDGTTTNQVTLELIAGTVGEISAGGSASLFVANGSINLIPDIPAADAAIGLISNGFTATWSSVSGATGYQLDVSINSSFSNFVRGYQNLDVGDVTSIAVRGLSADTTYYYRIRTYDSTGTSASSSTITVTTSAAVVVTTPLTVSTLAGQALSSGNSDGTGSAARFYYPSGIAADNAGNVYLADTDNHTVRKIVAATGAVTTLAGLAGSSGDADGIASAARFNSPSGVAVDGAGNIYVADTMNDTLRKVTASGVVSTLAGSRETAGSIDGTGSAALFQGPQGLAIDSGGNLYVADTNNHTIRKVVPTTGVVTTVAGLAGNSGSADGLGSLARFSYPSGIAVDGTGNLYVADTDNHTIRAISTSGLVSTLAGLAGSSGGADGTGSAVRFDSPSDLAVDSSGNIYVVDTDNFTIRKVVPTTGVVSTLAGLAGTSGSIDGLGAAVRFFHPAGITVDSSGDFYLADTNNHTVRVGFFAVAPAIQTQPQSQTVTAGNSVQFTVTASGRPAVTYQWYFGGTAISGATSSTYNLSNAQSGTAGNYTVVVSNVMGSATSNAASLTVNAATPPPGGGSSDSGGGGGGGGAPSVWFNVVLLLLAAGRAAVRRRVVPAADGSTQLEM